LSRVPPRKVRPARRPQRRRRWSRRVGVLVASPHINTLINFRFHPLFDAERGEHGMGSNCTGAGGKDLDLAVPIGTLVYEKGGPMLTGRTRCSPIYPRKASASSSPREAVAASATRASRPPPIVHHARCSRASLAKSRTCVWS
jgi:Predicted GTPase